METPNLFAASEVAASQISVIVTGFGPAAVSKEAIAWCLPFAEMVEGLGRVDAAETETAVGETLTCTVLVTTDPVAVTHSTPS